MDKQSRRDVWNVWREHCGEPPWATVASACTVLVDELLKELSRRSNLGLMVKALDKLLAVGYSDRVVCVGRELITLVYAWKTRKKGLQELEVGGKEWRDLEGKLGKRNRLFERVKNSPKQAYAWET